jgi:hypothetical protein
MIAQMHDKSRLKSEEVEWDDNNIEHIARHGVFPDEVEDVAFDNNPWIRKVEKEQDICLVIPLPEDICLSCMS